jgi:hypothetical protein
LERARFSSSWRGTTQRRLRLPPRQPTRAAITTPPGTTPDGGNVPPATYNEGFTDVFGGTLDKFISGLTNAPNYINLVLPGGASFTESNAVGTFGGGNGTTLTSPEEDAIRAQMAKDYYDYTSHNTDSYYTAYTANLNNWFDVLKTWYSQGGFWVGGGQGGNVTTTSDPPMTGDPRGGGMTGDPRGGGMTGDPRGGGAFDALIKAACASGDTACARRVAPGWRGTPIAGW